MSKVAELKASVADLEHNVEVARDALLDARDNLRGALLAANPRTADDYRIAVSQDTSYCWDSAEAMLADVFGDFYLNEQTGEYTELAAKYVDAFENGDGVWCWSATLQVLDPLSRGDDTEEWIDEDSCGGFFSLQHTFYTDALPAIRDQLTPRDVKGEIDYVEA